jgi:DinB superfamily
MKTGFFCIVMFASLTAMSQRDSLPYAAFPPVPGHYSAGTVVSRMLDGLGFRYYWATEGLSPIDLAFRPNPAARTSQETLEHIYDLSAMIVNVIAGDQHLPSRYTTFAELRKATLENYKKASALIEGYSDADMEKVKANFGDTTLPFWNMINGPISDCLWHVGQVVSFRRSSGNPFSAKVEVFLGKIMN